MKKSIKSIMILLIIAIMFGIMPNIVNATENDIADENIWVAWTIKNEKGEEVEGISGGGDYGLQDMVIPSYNDYTNCYFEMVVNEYVGKTITLDGLGTFTYTNQQRKDDEFNWYIYKLNISEPAKFNHAMSAQVFQFDITVESTGKTYTKYLDFSVWEMEKKTYKVQNDKLSIEVGAMSENELSLKAEELTNTSDTYVKMINQKLENNELLYVFDISLVGGEYKGKLPITFTVGEQYNGRKINVCHAKANGIYENFYEIVKDGKISITVSELSPFMLSLVKEETTTNNNSSENNTGSQNKEENEKELDQTPKTGVTEIAYYVLPVAIISALGIVIFRKKNNK